MMSMFSSFDLNSTMMFFFLTTVYTMNLFSKIYKMEMFNLILSNLMNELLKFFYPLKKNNMKKMDNFMILTVFFSVLFLNFSSILPYNFPLTSQMSVVMFFSLAMWVSSIYMMLTQNFKGLLSHCIPEGSPIYLAWFLFLIEIMSNMIRPVTVTVRLVANILAGHLLMNLLSMMVFKFEPMFMTYLVLTLMEMFVALIQSYIYVTMFTLYLSENE